MDPTFKSFQPEWMQIALKKAVRVGSPSGKVKLIAVTHIKLLLMHLLSGRPGIIFLPRSVSDKDLFYFTGKSKDLSLLNTKK